MHIVMVAGEASGDILGAGLMQAMLKLDSSMTFSGIGGERMLALGFNSLFPLDRLSVMGFVEPLKRLPELLHIRKTIKQHCLERKAVAFIGIDSPDFNLNIEKFAKEQGIKAIHYVSPSVWAWRQGRIKGIKKSIDLMLTLLPFEAQFYRDHDVDVAFVGHPLADEIPMQCDTQAARTTLNLSVEDNEKVLAVMPGSRSGEVGLLGPLFLSTLSDIAKQASPCQFIIPCANDARKSQIQSQIDQLPDELAGVKLRLVDGQSHDVMAASDAVLLASGTTALEAMLLKKPMVVAYKLHPFTYFIAKFLVKTPYVALPNLLAKEALVPELIQDDANSENILKALVPLLTDACTITDQVNHFNRLHDSIHKDASLEAAKTICRLLKRD